MSTNPKISIIVPAYNVGPFIAETLESALAQTRRDFEVIVVNDGSTDDTEARIAPYRDRIVYLRHENRGVMATRNAGIAAARGAYLALLDGDDLWEPRFLESLAGMLDADAGLGVAYPNAVFFGSPNFAGRLHQDVFPVAEPVSFDRVLRRECYVFGSLVFRRSVIDAVGGFDEGLQGQGAEDFELWLRMLRHGIRFGFSREPLAQYRWRHNSLSNTGVGLMKCVVSVYEKTLAKYDLDPSQRAWVEARLPELRAQLDLALFKAAAANGRYPEASRHLADANRFYRRPKLAFAQIAMRLAPAWVGRMVGG
ncbi:MAG: glycosyltransferase family A protein [Blastocatellia bacterium]|nr:glycosyltransferase family A protein [Blastocatellia bacterium]